MVGRLTRGVGWLVVVGVAGAIFVGMIRSGGHAGGIIGKMALLLGGLVGFPFLYVGSRLSARSAEQTLTADPRSPVLYLRSFTADADPIPSRWWRTAKAMALGRADQPQSEEEELAATFGQLGPPVAIGRPGEWLPQLGFSRTYVADDEWQAVVAGLSANAALTVLRIGDTPGLWWELRRVAQTLEPRRVLLYLLSPDVSERRRIYDVFRERANEILPRPLPAEIGDARFVWFDDAWRPILLDARARLLFDPRPPVLHLHTGDADDEDACQADGTALAAVFGEIGPVLVLGRSGGRAPTFGEARLQVADDEWAEVVRTLSWRGAPVVLRLGAGDGVRWTMGRAVEALDPERMLCFVPGRRRRHRQRVWSTVRPRVAELLPHPLPERIDRARYVRFDARWRPVLLDERGPGPWGWFVLMASLDRHARRARATVLRPIFDAYRREVPGSRVALRVWIGMAAVLVLGMLSLAMIASTRTAATDAPADPLDTAADLAIGWEGHVWGTSAARMAAHLRDEPDTGTAEPTVVESRDRRSFAGIEMPMRFVFLRGRLVGAILEVPASHAGDLARVRSALTGWLGPPRSGGDEPVWMRGPVQVRIRSVGASHVIMVYNTAAVRTGRRR